MARFDIEIGKKGNGATDVSRSIDEIINKLSNAERYSEVFNNSLKGQQTALRAYEGALKNLISQGFDRLDPSVKAVKSEIDKLTASINTQKSSIADQRAIDNLNIKLKQIASNEALMSNETARAAAQTRAFQAAINALIKNGVDPADSRITSLKNNISQLGSTQSRSGGGFFAGLASQAIGAVTAMASVYTAINAIKAVASSNIGISDQLSDVRRTAEMTRREVEAFADELKNIPTRTGLSELLDIAVIGGQLGIAKNELAGFVQALDFLGVALATEIPGGAEAVAEALGKINGVFKVTQKEGISSGEAMQKTGSAILALGQAGLATGQFITNFANRVGGAASVVDIALPTMLAYGAVLEESGVSAEVAGTAVSKLLGQLAVKRADFAAIAQLADASLTLEEFTDLINTDANAALQKFFQGLDAGGTSTTAFYDILGQAGINTERYRNAVLLLSQNQERLAELTALSTKEFEAGSNAAEQFALRNMNLAGVLGQVGRMIKEAFISPEAQNGLALFIAQATGLASKSDLLRMKLKDVSDELSNMESEIRPLMARYQQLALDTNRSAEENEELREVINKIADILPGAVTQWDEYGNAIEISTGKVVALTEAQRQLVRDTNISYGEQLNKEYEDVIKNIEEIADLQRKLSLSGAESMPTRFSEVSGMPRGFVDAADLAEKMAKEQSRALEIINNLLSAEQSLTEEQQKRLDFYTKEKDLKNGSLDVSEAQNDTTEKQIGLIRALENKLKDLKDARPDITSLSELNENKRLIDEVQAELDKLNGKEASRRVISDLDKIKKFIEDSDFSVSLLGMDDRGRAEAQIRKRYESIISSVKIGSDEYVRLNENMNIEIEASNKKFADADAKLISDMVQKRAKAIQDQAAKIVAANEKEYQDLLKAHQNYLQKIQEIEEKYGDAISRARSEGRDSEANEMARSQAKEIADVYQKEIKDSEPFQALEESLKNSSLKVARAALKSAKSAANSFIDGIKDPKIKAEIERFFGNIFNDIDVELKAENFDVVTDLVNGFERLVDQAGSFDESMAKSLKTISSMVSVVGDVANTLAKSSKNPLFQNISGTAGIIAGTVGILGGIVGAIEQRQARKAAEQAERVQKQNEQSMRVIDAMTKSLQRQLEVIELIYGVERVTEWQRVSNEAVESVENTLSNMGSFVVGGGEYGIFTDKIRELGFNTIDEVEAEVDRLQKRIKKYRWNPFVDTTNDAAKLGILKSFLSAVDSGAINTYQMGWETISDITREGAEQIRKDIEEGKFDEVTAKELSSMLDQWEVYMNAQRKLMEEFTGSSLESIIQDTTSLFFNAGEDSAEAWSKGFDKIMENYLIRKFQRDFLEKEMEAWYDKFAKYAEDGLDEYEKEELRRDREEIWRRGDQYLDDVTDALGYDPRLGDVGADGRSASGLRGSIERMSEQTGSELTGIYRADYELSKESLGKLHFIDVNMNALVGINGQQLSVLEGIKEDTEQIAEHTSFLEDMNYTLIEIAENTRAAKGKSERDLG